MRKYLLVIGWFFQGAAHALGHEVTYDELISQYQNQIIWVGTCGSWHSGNHSGFYRVIHASLYAQSLMYVQWMETNKEGINNVRFTLSIPELNNDHAQIDLEEPICKATQAGIAINAIADSANENRLATIVISVGQSYGNYRFEKYNLEY